MAAPDHLIQASPLHVRAPPPLTASGLPTPRLSSPSSPASCRPLTESDGSTPLQLRPEPPPVGYGHRVTHRHTRIRVPVSTAGESAAPTRSSPCSPGASDPSRLDHASPTTGSRYPRSPSPPSLLV
ncbi:hypothetical protein BDV93DRAFT_555283 [Ceratobasidium sp. AG-I]|nr:hypothetical protein BDV93DRAFT_555283 [Ceratobasidium sp. AG-I]